MKREIDCCDTCYKSLDARHFIVRLHLSSGIEETVMCGECTEMFLDLLKQEAPSLPVERKGLPS